MSRFQSTRPIRGATCAQSIVEFDQDISIHAPHTGRDTPWSTPWTGSPYFNPRAPYGARLALIWRPAHDQNFNPRAPYGARRGRTGEPIRGAFISIHAPHTGRDLGYGLQVRDGKLFQSTRPIRGATTNCSTPSMRLDYFNPRAPYGARPIYTSSPYSAATDFNPRAPYGARLIVSHDGSRVLYEFQSTRPIRGATLLLFCSRYPFDISIHAPHTGRDVAPNAIKPMPMDFNPRAPYGARPHRPSGRRAYRSISIHAPHTGRDMY